MKSSVSVPDLAAIEQLTKTLADARQLVTDRVTALHDELEAAKRRRIPGLKSAVAAAMQAESELAAAIKSAPGMFAEPRTLIVHGMRVGYAKGRGRIEWDDEATVIAKIEKLFPRSQAELLVKTVKTLRRKALNGLVADDVRRIGCRLVAAGDAVYIAPVADDVDKLVTRLLKQETPDQDGGES